MRVIQIFSAALAIVIAGVNLARAADPKSEPITFVGHGALFDSSGNEILLTPEFAQQTQNWYSSWLRSRATPETKKQFEGVLRTLTKGLALSPADRLLANQAAIVWFAESMPAGVVDPKMLGRLRALEYRLRLSPGTGKSLYMKWPNAPSALLQGRITSLREATSGKFLPSTGGTTKSGKEYVEECKTSGVPIPPPIGKLDSTGKDGWRSGGFLQGKDQFIVGTIAEVRVYESDAGMCYALPRYTDDSKNEVAIDGVICLSKVTAKVCFWDNQMQGKAFSFAAGTLVPIGFPDTAINPDGLYQAGGAELEGGEGGVCTDCHAGENPFVVHPRAELANGITWGSVQDLLPAFGPDRYIPIVPASWPQNSLSSSGEQVPKGCISCHEKEEAGRFPSLNATLEGYCKRILPQAAAKTMPPRKPGSQVGEADVIAFQKLCENN